MNIQELESYFERTVPHGDRSERTADLYTRAALKFEEWYSGPGDPEAEDVMDWIREGRSIHDLSGSTLNIRKCAMCKYFSVTGNPHQTSALREWFSDEFTVTSNPTFDYFKREELRAVKSASKSDKRSRALVALLSETGMRKSEIRALDEEDVWFSDGIVRITRVKRRDRPVHSRPLSQDALDAVREYTDSMDQYGPPDAVASDPLFVTSVYSDEGWRVSDSYVDTILHDVAEVCDHPDVDGKRMHAHLFRHTVGAYLGMEGKSASEIADFFGQKSSESAERYTHFDAEKHSEMHSVMGV